MAADAAALRRESPACRTLCYTGKQGLLGEYIPGKIFGKRLTKLSVDDRLIVSIDDRQK